MRHTDIWKAVDALAERNGLSASGLARRAGLDPTAFNKSKRADARWLAALALHREPRRRCSQAVGSSLEDFAALAEGRQGHTAPLLGFAKAGSEGYFDDAGFPTGDGWEEVRFPGLETRECLRAGDHWRFDGAGLSPRRSHRRRAGSGRPPW